MTSILWPKKGGVSLRPSLTGRRNQFGLSGGGPGGPIPGGGGAGGATLPAHTDLLVGIDATDSQYLYQGVNQTGGQADTEGDPVGSMVFYTDIGYQDFYVYNPSLWTYREALSYGGPGVEVSSGTSLQYALANNNFNSYETGDNTIILVVEDPGNSFGGFSCDTTQNYCSFAYRQGTSNSLSVYHQNSNTEVELAACGKTGAHAIMVELDHTSATATMTVDNGTPVSHSFTGTTFNLYRMCLNQADTPAGNFRGGMGGFLELQIYGRELTAGEKAQTWAYVGSEYGISV